MTTQQFYTDKATGKKWPLVEAEVDYTFQVHKSDRRKAVIGDPTVLFDRLRGLKQQQGCCGGPHRFRQGCGRGVQGPWPSR